MWGSTGEFPDGTAAFHNTLLTSLPAEAQSPVTSATDCFFFFVNWQLVGVFWSMPKETPWILGVVLLMYSLIQQILKVCYEAANI